jgi:hypothetical protein
MNPMNRCKNPMRFLMLAALSAMLVPAGAQTVPIPNTQNEAAQGGRNFPTGTLRGQFMVVAWPQIQLAGQAEQLAPGARIMSANRMLVMPASITGQNLLVNYKRDAAGLVHDVWILTPGEAATDRASADRPLFNFWPFR